MFQYFFEVVSPEVAEKAPFSQVPRFHFFYFHFFPFHLVSRNALQLFRVFFGPLMLLELVFALEGLRTNFTVKLFLFE